MATITQIAMTDLAGQTFEITHPFTWEKVNVHGEDIETWCPGVRIEAEDHEWSDDEPRWFADGEGKQIITVISVHKPGRYPERVFFIRQWRDPDGKQFSKGKLRMTTVVALRRRIAGYHYEYEVS